MLKAVFKKNDLANDHCCKHPGIKVFRNSTWYKILKFILLLLRIYLIKFFEVEMVNIKAHGHSDL